MGPVRENAPRQDVDPCIHYMVPAGTDDGGCQQYKPWSAGAPVTAAIYYRGEEGTFTLARPEDGCADDG